MNTQLNSFETQLLVELREYVADRAATESGSQGPQPRFNRTRLAVLGSAAVALIAAMLVAPGFGTSPAYSVGEGNAGEVHVEINRPEDADGLERALADRGISADITYLPRLQTCAPGRYSPVDREPTGMQATIGEQYISVTLPPSAVRDGETFVLTWSGVRMPAEDMAEVGADTGWWVTDGFASTIDFGVASGAVAPCQPVAE